MVLKSSFCSFLKRSLIAPFCVSVDVPSEILLACLPHYNAIIICPSPHRHKLTCLTVNLFSCLFAIQLRAEQLALEGWEYSPVFTMKFHAKERKMDLVRRRRWHRKMVQEDPSAPAVFHIDVGSSDDVRICFCAVQIICLCFSTLLN